MHRLRTSVFHVLNSFVIRILGAVLEDTSEFDVVKLAVFDRSLFVQVIHFVLSESIAQCC